MRAFWVGPDDADLVESVGHRKRQNMFDAVWTMQVGGNRIQQYRMWRTCVWFIDSGVIVTFDFSLPLMLLASVLEEYHCVGKWQRTSDDN